MKRRIYSIFAVAVLALSSACQMESADSGVCAINYSVRVSDAVGARSSGAVDSQVNELVYEVYRTDGERVESLSDTDELLYEGTAEIVDGVANFSLNHVKMHNLTVLFWAQVKVAEGQTPVYDVDDLRCVEINSTVGAGQNAEAFAGRDFVVKGKSLSNGNVKLLRPVSQLKLATVAESLSMYGAPVNVTGSILKVKGLAKTFDVASMECGDVSDDEVVYTTDSISGETITIGGSDYVCLAMNYLGFIPADGTTVDVSYVFNADGVDVENNVGNIPVKANFRTNIIGDLLTAVSDYDVTVGDWTDGVNKVIVVNTATELQDALNEVTGGERIVLARNIDTDQGVQSTRGVSYTLDFNGKTVNCGGFSFTGTAAQSDVKVVVRNGNVVTDKTALSINTDMTVELVDVNVEAIESLVRHEAGNLIITGGTYRHTGIYGATSKCGFECSGSSTLVINSGSFDSRNGLFRLRNASLTISGGEFYGEVQSTTPDRKPLINNFGGRLTVNGGTFRTKDGIVDLRTNNN